MSATSGKMTFDEFKARARRAGLSLSDEQLRESFGAYAHIEVMIGRLRPDEGRGIEAEPAHVFNAAFEVEKDTAP